MGGCVGKRKRETVVNEPVASENEPVASENEPVDDKLLETTPAESQPVIPKPLPFISSLAARAVPSAPLEEISSHRSYHGKMTGEEAGRILQEYGGTCYLTRYSKSNDSYMLSVIQRKVGRDKDDFLLEHYKLTIDEWGHAEIEGTKKTFEDISELLLFYKKKPIDHDILGIGKTVRAQKEVRITHILTQKSMRSRSYQDNAKLSYYIIYLPFNHQTLSIRVLDVQDSDSDDEDRREIEKSYWKKPSLGIQPIPRLTPRLTLATLKDLQWADEEGEIQHFHLIAEVSDTWRDVAILLGMGNAAVVNIDQKSNDNVRRFEEVMTYWLENCTSHDTYPATWSGLQELLRAVQRGTAAEKIKNFIRQPPPLPPHD